MRATRLVCVRYLFTGTDLDILSVGLACGFTSASSFSRAFRQHFGKTPRQVREG
ncbi:helix-turn-helix domain-containing protein [Onishia taeanensis]|uniref:helix-turn-helix domain-containing protein n=1 Tax=Onishia taeanensis TaxID=284577 RepID=UPI0021ABD063|nr:helix-turn-helix domain-containing protein [Halomonas taeanensis]